MAQALILDSEGLNALARAEQRPVLAQRGRAILQVAREEGALVRVPAPILAEVCRGGALDAPIGRILNGRGIEVIDLCDATARRAGSLLRRARLGSVHAIDAFVVATAQTRSPAPGCSKVILAACSACRDSRSFSQASGSS